ncbi:MAG: ABC transporter permease [Clostridia bacterium]|nr:ABC transporter permease [Clostridia bacterium]MBQ6708190.1 ABC transporter permease [Clostridia bacterium]
MANFINFFYAAILSGTPLLFGTTGEILCEKAGGLNLGVEGMMWIGAFAGFYTAWKTESVFLAFLVAFASAALGALLYAFLTITLKTNQNVTGLTLTTFGIGISTVLGFAMTENAGGNPQISSEFMSKLAPIEIPFLSSIPYIGKMFLNYNPFVYIAIVIAIVIALIFKFSKTGLAIRAIGENPSAADAAGINVTLHKYLCTIIGGGICGIGGAYMSIITLNGTWQSGGGVVGGYGWIAVALVIFASWSSAKAIIGSFIFGAFTCLQYYIGQFSFLPAFIREMPVSIYQMLPFLLTTIVLIISSVNSKKISSEPHSLGLNYFREDR